MRATAPWPLTGRDEELRAVVEMLDGSADDAGVVIAGQAGVGKTRLAREAATRAANLGWAVRWIAGTTATQSIPLGAWVQWAAGIEGHPLRIVSDLIEAVTTSPEGAPVLVLVDDAHLLDDLSAYVLYQLVVRRAATVIATVRGGEHVPDVITALWKDALVRRIDLQPLSRSQSDALLERALGGPADSSCAKRMWHLTFGNVLFLRQLIAQELDAQRLVPDGGGWQWEGPMTVTGSLLELIDTQIGAVSDAAGDVIDMVAVAEPLELEYLTQLADSAAIEYCEQRGLIVVSPAAIGPQRVRVGHPLYGEARRARMGAMRLARLSGQLVSAMTGQGSVSVPDPVRVGRLWLESDLAPDVAVFMRAAQVAYDRHDIALTSRFAEAAVAAGAGPEARLLLAHTLMHSATPQRAQEILDQLASGPLPDMLSSAVGQLRAANLLWPLARPDASWAVIDEGLSARSRELAAQAQAFRTMQLAMAARPAEALATSSGIDREHLGDMPTLMLAWAHAIAFGDLGRPDEAVAAADVAAAATAWPSAAMQGPGSALAAVQALALSGDIDRVRLLAERADQQWSDVPGAFRAFAAATSALASLAAGDIRNAHVRLRRALAESASTESRIGVQYCLSLIYLETACRSGELDAIAEATTLVDRHRHPAFTFLDAYAELAMAWASAAGGRLAQARAIAESAAECARSRGQLAWEVRCRQTAVQFGDTRQGPRLGELASQVQGPRAALAGRWATALSHHDAAELLAVSNEFEAIGDRLCAADAAAHAAVAYRGNQHNGPALTAAARARRLITSCGATSPATRVAETPLPLTNRERDVAELVAMGMSNKQIAEELSLSVRTVEGNILRCCTKLGLRDRIELANLMRELARGAGD